MNHTIEPAQEIETITPSDSSEKATDAKAPVKSFESIVKTIRLDALYDSLKYVLRSDTGHDGE